MPIYEYTCSQCNAHVEKIQRFTDAPLKTCPHCGGPLHKKVSLSAFQLKGSGWYVTDYAGKKSFNQTAGENGNGNGNGNGHHKPDAGKTESGESKDATKTTAPAGSEKTPTTDH
ncbi:MAG: zinc ribbon domain-containing protein [Myxococcales bacterium]|nr:zinc ribbon domain-containing protein [Myxococcales bacterium]